MTPGSITPALAAKFGEWIPLKLINLSLLPHTAGFTDFSITALTLAILALSYWLLARLIQSGKCGSDPDIRRYKILTHS